MANGQGTLANRSSGYVKDGLAAMAFPSDGQLNGASRIKRFVIGSCIRARRCDLRTVFGVRLQPDNGCHPIKGDNGLHRSVCLRHDVHDHVHVAGSHVGHAKMARPRTVAGKCGQYHKRHRGNHRHRKGAIVEHPGARNRRPNLKRWRQRHSFIGATGSWRPMGAYENRRVLIAGAGTGAGRALAVEAARAGAQVFLASRTQATLQDTAQLVASAGDSRAEWKTADVSDPAQAEALLDGVQSKFGGLDVVFCLAGSWFNGALHHQTPTEIERGLSEIVRPVLVLNQLAPSYLKQGRWPAIVNFGAAYGTAATLAGQTIYNALKASVTELTRSLAADLISDGIRVNAVLPGAISHTYDARRGAQEASRLGIDPGWPQDVAHAALFLASPQAAWITGSCLRVDGGFAVNRQP